MIKEIVTDETKLAERCNEVDVRKDNEQVRALTVDLKETLREYKTGIGLAAPQIGSDFRMFVINFNGDIRTFINPVITNAENLTLSREGCLSMPGKEYIIPRYAKVDVMYQTPLGKTESRKMMGLAAFTFQHELDHLDGLLMSDIGLEITPEFDAATEEERDEVLQAYLDSLDLKSKAVKAEIEKDPKLKQQNDAINFMQSVISGKTTVEHVALDKETSDKIREVIKEKTESEKSDKE